MDIYILLMIQKHRMIAQLIYKRSETYANKRILHSYGACDEIPIPFIYLSNKNESLHYTIVIIIIRGLTELIKPVHPSLFNSAEQDLD